MVTENSTLLWSDQGLYLKLVGCKLTGCCGLVGLDMAFFVLFFGVGGILAVIGQVDSQRV